MIRNAIVTDRVKREGLSAVYSERQQQTIAMVRPSTCRRPIPASIYRPDFLPPRAELRAAVTSR